MDAQKFEHLKFAKTLFADWLLAHLLEVAPSTVVLDGDNVIIKHCYIERRVIPLNIYVEQAHPEAARAAIIDYGNALKDLIASNIFPGDLLLKNFGVTRHGRVVFYDYDELCLLTECKFRRMPQSDFYEDELADVPWFSVGENDVFPEEFEKFLGLNEQLKQLFIAKHADLFDPSYWKTAQNRIKAGEILHIVPYKTRWRSV